MEPPSIPFVDPIRPTVRAVIRRNGEILVQVKEKAGRSRFLTLPGGKQEAGESVTEALQRECAEEIGATVTVGPLIHVADVIKPKEDGLRHQLELLFACEVPNDYVAKMGPHPDPSQTGTIWANLKDHADQFQPAYAVPLTTQAPIYLGVLNG